MFEFTTQTVFNKVIKTTDANVKAKTAPKGYNVVTSSTGKPEVRIGNTRFNADNILSVQVRRHTPEHLAKAEIDISDLITLVTGASDDAVQEGSYRIVLNVGLSMNSQDSFYANPFVYKGKPFFIEFPIKASDEAADVAARLVKIADKYLLFTTNEKILNVTANGAKVTFEGVNGYQQFKSIEVQKFDPDAILVDCCSTVGDFATIMTGVPVTYSLDASADSDQFTMGTKTLDSDGLRNLEDNEFAIEPGIEAFLDYDWMVHNLRLPTLANTNWWTANKSELPIVGGEYTQIIIRMSAKRLGVSGSVVGHETTSVTTHVLYVLDQGSNVSNITTALAALSNVTVDEDDDIESLENPYKGAGVVIGG